MTNQAASIFALETINNFFLAALPLITDEATMFAAAEVVSEKLGLTTELVLEVVEKIVSKSLAK